MMYAIYFPHYIAFFEAREAWIENPSAKNELNMKTCYRNAIHVVPVVGAVARSLEQDENSPYWPIHKGYAATCDSDYEFSCKEEAVKAAEEDIQYSIADRELNL